MLATLLLSPTIVCCLVPPFALAAPQSPLTALVDWKDGRVADGVGPGSAVELPQEERFWIGQGLRRAQIRIGDRERRFIEEQGADQNYQTSILDMELDESSASTEDHRLLVLTGWSPKGNALARLQVLEIFDPSVPSEVAHVDFVSSDATFFDIKDIALIEEEQLVVAVGSKSSPDNRMVLQLYSYAPGAANPEGELPLVAEILQASIPLQNCGDLGPRLLGLPRAVHVHQIDGQWFAFVIGATSAPQKPGPGGVTVCRIDPDAIEPDPMLAWYTATTHVFDPVYETFCGSLEPCYQVALSQEFMVTLQDVGVNHLDVVELPGSPATHLAYLAGNAFSQILELDVSNFASTGFGPPTRIPIFVPLPNSHGEMVFDDLHWIESYRESVSGADMLLVLGQHYLHLVSRTPPPPPDPLPDPLPPPPVCGEPHERAHFEQRFGIGSTAQVMLEDPIGPMAQTGLLLLDGIRAVLWTLAYDTSYGWSTWDITDRHLHPVVDDPEPMDLRYAPGGTDGAVMVYEGPGSEDRRDIYVPTFGGVVRYEFTFNGDFEDPAGSVEPIYDSYQPALVGGVEDATEQLELGVLVAGDERLFAPNGRGGIVQWKLDLGSRNPLPPTLLSGSWGGVLGSGAYSLRSTFGRGVISDRPYVLVDLSVDKLAAGDPQAEVLLGRCWLDYAPPVGTVYEDVYWQMPLVLDDPTDVSFDSEFPTAPYDPTDPLDLVYGYVRDLAIAPTGQWALAACTNGVFAVALYGGPFEVLEDLDWRVTDTFYPFDTPLRPDPFGPDRSFTKVEGVCWLGTQHLAMSFSNEEMGQESSGGLAVFSFLHHVGTIGEPVVHFLDQPERPSSAAVDQIPGTDFYLGGSLRSHLLPDGTYRIYATSHYSGAVVEYEFDPFGSGPSSVTHLSTWSDDTHFSETTDCRPYDVGHPDGVPVVLVGRFLQTIAVLAATGFEVEPPE